MHMFILFYSFSEYSNVEVWRDVIWNLRTDRFMRRTKLHRSHYSINTHMDRRVQDSVRANYHSPIYMCVCVCVWNNYIALLWNHFLFTLLLSIFCLIHVHIRVYVHNYLYLSISPFFFLSFSHSLSNICIFLYMHVYMNIIHIKIIF